MVRVFSFAVIFLLLVKAPYVWGQGNDVFSVSGIAVTVEGDPQTARDRAYQTGQSQAWQKLMGQIAGNPSVPQPSAAELSSWIRDFDIEEEKVAPQRYFGRFTYRFASEPVRAYLQRNRIAIAEQAPTPSVVIPILIDSGGGALLWERQNFWANAWRDFHQPSFPVIIPIGSVEDVQGLTTSQVMSGDIGALQKIAARYGTGGAIVVIATLTGNETTGFGLELKATRYGTAQPEIIMASIPFGEKSIDLLMRNGVDVLVNMLSQSWKQANLVDTSQLNTVLVRVFITNLASWVDLQRRLNSVPNIRERHIESISRQEAVMVINYAGTPEQFNNALANVGLSMANALGGGAILGVNSNWRAPLGTPQNLNAPTNLTPPLE